MYSGIKKKRRSMQEDRTVMANTERQEFIDALTEELRQREVQRINGNPRERKELEVEYGQVWDTQELGQDFEVRGFAAPFVVVRRRSDNQLGSLSFQHHPRFYFDFVPDEGK